MAFEHTGKVKCYYQAKRFGFITLDSGDEAFFHQSAISRNITPKPGDRVMCTIEQAEKGPRATQVAMAA
jgi:cold shock CspA family protein